jgi:hypothetical protein
VETDSRKRVKERRSFVSEAILSAEGAGLRDCHWRMIRRDPAVNACTHFSIKSAPTGPVRAVIAGVVSAGGPSRSNRGG